MKAIGDVIVAGGGVIGLTAAYFLGKEGVRVLLFDKGQTGMEASWAGAGIVPPSDPTHARDPFDRLRALSGRLFPQLSAELKERTGVDNGFLPCGGLQVIDPAHAVDPKEWYSEGIRTEVLDAGALRKMEPALASDLGAAIHVPSMAQLRNPWHMRALRAAALGTGHVAIREDAAVTGFVIEHGRVKGIRTESEVITGHTVIAAAGAWTERLLEPLGCRLKIEPVRGQIALMNAGRVLFRHIVMRGAQYLVPRPDGRVLAGSTEEHVGFDKATTAGAIAGLLELAVKLVPALASATLEKTWAGLRPGSPDSLPFIGPVPGVENLLVAAGHFRAGIQLSPGTALLLKEMILGQPLSMPIDAFRVDRGH